MGSLRRGHDKVCMLTTLLAFVVWLDTRRRGWPGLVLTLPGVDDNVGYPGYDTDKQSVMDMSMGIRKRPQYFSYREYL